MMTHDSKYGKGLLPTSGLYRCKYEVVAAFTSGMRERYRKVQADTGQGN